MAFFINHLVDNNGETIRHLVFFFQSLYTLYFPTRIQNNSVPAIDNIFIDHNRSGNNTISLLVNDPSIVMDRLYTQVILAF
jgi:hypothetical protein